MSKEKFPNLGRGGAKLQGSLSSFKKKGTNNLDYNPLTEKKRTRIQKEAEPSLDEEEIPPQDTSQPIVPVSIESKPDDTPKEKVKPKKKKRELIVPADFKSHSALFSNDQLNALRHLVNFKKWKENPKFTIQLAIYEAVENLLEARKPVKYFPDDFVTYAPAFSEEQWGRLEEFVAEIRFKEGKYALKYAIYEAIKMYLSDNPIKY